MLGTGRATAMREVLATEQVGNHPTESLQALAHGLGAQFFGFTLQHDEIIFVVTAHGFILSNNGGRQGPDNATNCSEADVILFGPNDEMSFLISPMLFAHRFNLVEPEISTPILQLCLMTNNPFNLKAF